MKLPGLLLIAMGVKLCILLAIGLRPVEKLISEDVLGDDPFYSFTVARSIARGHGAAFSGGVKTNGYQPLYVWLTAPFFRFFNPESDAPIHAALALLAIFSVLSAIPLFRLIRHLTSSKNWALAGSLGWLFFPMLFKRQVNGLETSMVGFFMILALDIYIRELRSSSNLPGWFSFIKLGIALGLLVLTRIDQAFLAAGMAADYLYLWSKGDRNVRASAQLERGAACALIALVIFSPWVLNNMVNFGGIVPVSGEATHLQAKFNAMLHFRNYSGARIFLYMFSRAFAMALYIHWPIEFASRLSKAEPLDIYVIGVALFIAGIFLLALMRISRNILKEWLREVSSLHFAILFYALPLFLIYAFYLFAPWHLSRYFYPFSLMYAPYMVVLIKKFLEKAGLTLKSRRAAIAALIGSYALLTWPLLKPPRAQFWSGLYEITIWMNENLEADAVVGTTQSGIIGYYSKHRVIDLGGKMDPAALDALKSNSLYDFAKKKGVTHLADMRSGLQCAFFPSAGRSFKEAYFTPVHTIRNCLAARLD